MTLRRQAVFLLLMATLVAFTLLPADAYAAATGPHAAAATISVRVLAMSAICGWAIPAVVDLVTKASLATPLKTLIATGLSALAGALTTVTWQPHERWTDYVFAIAVAVVNTQGAHRILVGIGDPVQKRLGKVGIGPKH